jgi:hypothetical protein
MRSASFAMHRCAHDGEGAGLAGASVLVRLREDARLGSPIGCAGAHGPAPRWGERQGCARSARMYSGL